MITKTIDDFIMDLGKPGSIKQFAVYQYDKKHEHHPPTEPFRTDHYTFIFITNGALRFKVNLIEYAIEKDNLVTILPNDIREILSVSNDCAFMIMTFTHNFLAGGNLNKKDVDLFHFFSSQSNPVRYIKPQDAGYLRTVLSVIHKKYSDLKEQLFHEEIINNHFSTLIYELGAIFKKTDSESFTLSSKEELTFKFMRLLESNINHKKNVQQYAADLFVSPRYLTQAVKQTTGKTPGIFIDEMLIIESKMLLNDLSLSVAQVADQLKFSDQFHFSKYFKKLVGTNPSSYRSQV